MMIVLAIERLDMQGQPGGLREGLEPFLEQLGVHRAEFGAREVDLPHEIRPIGTVERDPGQGRSGR